MLVKSRHNCLGEGTSDQNVIPRFIFFLESISFLPGSGNKANVCFRESVISRKLGGRGWLGGWDPGEGLILGTVLTPMCKPQKDEVSTLPFIL